MKFGLRITYGPTLLTKRMIRFVCWYKTEADRQAALMYYTGRGKYRVEIEEQQALL
jgi:hypothetical protein